MKTDGTANLDRERNFNEGDEDFQTENQAAGHRGRTAGKRGALPTVVLDNLPHRVAVLGRRPEDVAIRSGGHACANPCLCLSISSPMCLCCRHVGRTECILQVRVAVEVALPIANVGSLACANPCLCLSISSPMCLCCRHIGRTECILQVRVAVEVTLPIANVGSQILSAVALQVGQAAASLKHADFFPNVSVDGPPDIVVVVLQVLVAPTLDPKGPTSGIDEIEALPEICLRHQPHLAVVVLQMLPTSTNTPEEYRLCRVNSQSRSVVESQVAAHHNRHRRRWPDDLRTNGGGLRQHESAGCRACLASAPIRPCGLHKVAIVDLHLHRGHSDLDLDGDLLGVDGANELPIRHPQPPTIREPTPLVVPVLWPDQASMLQIRQGDRHKVAAFFVSRGPCAQASALAGGHRAIAHVPNVFEVVVLGETNGVDGVLVEAAFDDL
mmetsp:Transcript_14075/g.45549  ORF Transcript_14075/g.45549 Transcript_14075/m.45549 type:complete len:441 (+) Transcript_14075:690-2012(+)